MENIPPSPTADSELTRVKKKKKSITISEE